MISDEQAKQVLGEKAHNLTLEEIREITHHLYYLSNTLVVAVTGCEFDNL